MRKADLINQISEKTGIPKVDVLVTLETMFKEVKDTLSAGENIYIRGFGSFITKKRAAKIGRNIKKNIAVHIPEHYIPAFKPAKEFVAEVKKLKEKRGNKNYQSINMGILVVNGRGFTRNTILEASSSSEYDDIILTNKCDIYLIKIEKLKKAQMTFFIFFLELRFFIIFSFKMKFMHCPVDNGSEQNGYCRKKSNSTEQRIK